VRIDPDTFEVNFGTDGLFDDEPPELHAVANKATDATTARAAADFLIFISNPFRALFTSASSSTLRGARDGM
jgi:hypothetical protein